VALGKLKIIRLCSSVTKQYNMLSVEGGDLFDSGGEVTAGLVESNGRPLYFIVYN